MIALVPRKPFQEELTKVPSVSTVIEVSDEVARERVKEAGAMMNIERRCISLLLVFKDRGKKKDTLQSSWTGLGQHTKLRILLPTYLPISISSTNFICLSIWILHFAAIIFYRCGLLVEFCLLSDIYNPTVYWTSTCRNQCF